MEKIMLAAEQLANLLEDSQTYRQYRESAEALLCRPDLTEKVRQVKQAIWEKEKRRGQNAEISQEEEDVLEQQYTALLLNPITGLYLEREKELLDLLKKVYAVLEKGAFIDRRLMD